MVFLASSASLSLTVGPALGETPAILLVSIRVHNKTVKHHTIDN